MKLKNGLLTVLVLIITTTAFSQTPKCKSLHSGVFKIYTPETGTTIIKRSGNIQIEINADLGVEIIFDIKWIDECTYELRPKELVKGDPSIMGDGTFVLRTTMKDISDKQYTAETTASFTPDVMNFVVEIVE